MDVKTLCLGVLSLGDATGYEIRKMFEEGPFAHFFDASYGSIYPALGRLLKDGFVNVPEEAQAGRPDKKIYHLTDSGLTCFKQALAEPPGRDRIRSESIVRLFFAEMMEPDDIRRVYDEYLAHFETMAAQMRELKPEGIPSGRLFARSLGLNFYSSMVQHMREHRDDFMSEVKND